MRYVYCDACGKVSRNFRFERDRCFSCGAPGETVDARNAWQYYASSVLLIAVAAVFVLVPIPNDVLRWGVLLGVLAVCFALSSWGMDRTRARILREKRGLPPKEEKA